MNRPQIIISIGREFGSGGHAIAEILSKRFELPLYDNNILSEIAEQKNLNVRELERFDEIPRNRLFSRNVQGYSNSPEENVAKMQFNFLRDKADKGDSFVVVGRCSDEVLRDYPFTTTIFVLGDLGKKIERISQVYNVSTYKAESILNQNNKKRKSYHNYYCRGKWGDSRNYELSINSSKLGLEKTADIIEAYIKEKMGITE